MWEDYSDVMTYEFTSLDIPANLQPEITWILIRNIDFLAQLWFDEFFTAL